MGVRNATEEILNKVRQAIAPEDRVLKAARERRDLAKGIAMKIRGALRAFNSGSVAHGTVNNPVSDADAGVVLDRRAYPELGPDGDGIGPTAVLETIASIVLTEIRRHYPAAMVEITKRALLISFNDPIDDEEDPSVDLIIALTRKDEPGLWIPNTEQDDWDASDPEQHTNLLHGPTDEVRVHRARTIRLAKAAIKQDGEEAVITSFNTEAEALDHVTEVTTLGESLRDLFHGAATTLSRGNSPDPAGVSDPIKLPDGITREQAMRRLGYLGDRVADAVGNPDDPDAALRALKDVFPAYLGGQAASTKNALASALRSGNNDRRIGSRLGAGAGALKTTRAYGGDG